MFSYFGYGSLVNRDTRPTGEQAVNARLNGWRRVWNHRVNFADRHIDPADAAGAAGCTSLSIEPLTQADPAERAPGQPSPKQAAPRQAAPNQAAPNQAAPNGEPPANGTSEKDNQPVGAESEHCSGIDGVLVPISAEQLAGLDDRESGYHRLHLPRSHFVLSEECRSEHIIVYQSLPSNQQDADEQFPILQSYIDCVMAGYAARFSMRGLRQMLRSTRGWDKPILNDRNCPLYPRHIKLDTGTADVFDELILECRQCSGSN